MGVRTKIAIAIAKLLKVEITSTPRGLNSNFLPNSLRESLERIPGMISISTAQIYYLLSVHQNMTGGIIEIGAWQGRSTVALAQSCKVRSLGEKVHVFEHFLGNPGNAKDYRVKDKELGDLQNNFLRNIAASDLDQHVILNATNVDNVDGTQFSGIRMLVIDGEHTYDAVLRDYHTFRSSLSAGSLVIFDDFHEDAPGVIRAVNKIRDNEPTSKLSVFGTTAVLSI
jgi:cephalosporin hydroxylase